MRSQCGASESVDDLIRKVAQLSRDTVGQKNGDEVTAGVYDILYFIETNASTRNTGYPKTITKREFITLQ